jgi:hypothetical protein
MTIITSSIPFSVNTYLDSLPAPHSIITITNSVTHQPEQLTVLKSAWVPHKFRGGKRLALLQVKKVS